MTRARQSKPRPNSRLDAVVTAFRERDWIGIAIELAVVTLGVLLAFQIDQWGQDQRQARQEHQFLERMWGDTATAIRENDWVIGIHARIRQSFTRAFNARNDPQRLAQMTATEGFGCGAESMIGLGFNDTSYQELSASGDLNIIGDPELRSALRDVAAAQADAVAQLEYSRQISIPLRSVLAPYEVVDLDRAGNRTCRIDWPALLQDPLARAAIARASQNHLLMWWKRAYTRDVLAKAHNRIACRLGKHDCVEQVPQIVGRRNYGADLPRELSSRFDATAARPVVPPR
jgi:hypothetical protein